MESIEHTDSLMSQDYIVRRAAVLDVSGIHQLIEYWSETTGDVLPRTETEIYETVRDFFVIRKENGILAAGALHVESKNLAEIKSLVVAPDLQGHGLGRLIVNACLNDAINLDIHTVFALTTTPDFFKRLGFNLAAISSFPRKVWNECVRCPKYENCDEVALSIDLSSDALVIDNED